MRKSWALSLVMVWGGGTLAQETTSIFMPYFPPGTPLLASVVNAESAVTTYSIACETYAPQAPNGCRVPIPFYVTEGVDFIHATKSINAFTEMRTKKVTRFNSVQETEYLYSFPAYTEDARCTLDSAMTPTSAACLVTATGGALTVPMFTHRRTLTGSHFAGAYHRAILTDSMPTSYADAVVPTAEASGPSRTPGPKPVSLSAMRGVPRSSGVLPKTGGGKMPEPMVTSRPGEGGGKPAMTGTGTATGTATGASTRQTGTGTRTRTRTSEEL